MASKYSSLSPYAATGTYGFFLDILEFKDIPKNSSDVVYQIGEVYRYRPDLLAYDLYGDTALWWVFAVRNPNTIEDPVFDFVPGTTIFIPKKEVIQVALGF